MSRRDQRGVAAPSPLVMLSIIAVFMAGIAFVATKDQPETERRIETVMASATPVTLAGLRARPYVMRLIDRLIWLGSPYL